MQAPIIALKKIAKEMKGLFNKQLVSVILHQSQLFQSSGQHQLLFVFNERIDFEVISRQLLTAKKLRKYFMTQSPLVFSKTEIQESADVFPIEFCDIAESETVLSGESIRQYFKIEPAHIRAEMEANLRRNVIHLRRSYFTNRYLLNTLIQQSFTNMIVTMKHAMQMEKNIIKGKPDIDTVMNWLAEKYGFSLEIYSKIKNLQKARGMRFLWFPFSQKMNRLFYDYLDQLVQLSDRIDDEKVKTSQKNDGHSGSKT